MGLTWNIVNLQPILMTHNSTANIDGLVQERRNSSALAMELHLFRTNPLIYQTNKFCFPFIFPSPSYPVILPACDSPMSTLVAAPWIIENHYVAPANHISLI